MSHQLLRSCIESPLPYQSCGREGWAPGHRERNDGVLQSRLDERQETAIGDSDHGDISVGRKGINGAMVSTTLMAAMALKASTALSYNSSSNSSNSRDAATALMKRQQQCRQWQRQQPLLQQWQQQEWLQQQLLQ